MDIYEKIEKIYADKYKAVLTSRKALGDFMISEQHAVNVKSNDINKKNYSPNIISAKKLVKWLLEEGNDLSFIFADYKIVDGEPVIINNPELLAVEHISWDCLSIEAQGWGVIQKPKELKIDKNQTRKQFLRGLKKALYVYKAKEMKKWKAWDKILKDI